jgi:hypothetical protein
VTDEQFPDDVLKALEREVGDLLAEAESLSGELSSEVGAAESARVPRGSTDGGETADDDVTRQLSDAQNAVDEAAAELGASPPPEPKKPKKVSLPPKGAMAPGPATPSNAASAGGLGGAAVPAASPAAAAGQAGRRIVLPSKRSAAGHASGADRLVAARVDASPVELPTLPTAGDRLRGLVPADGIRNACHRSAHTAIVALEWLDRPFRRVGYRVRVALGWCALALAAAAIAVYFFAVR